LHKILAYRSARETLWVGNDEVPQFLGSCNTWAVPKGGQTSKLSV
jgi:hypothetical protein